MRLTSPLSSSRQKTIEPTETGPHAVLSEFLGGVLRRSYLSPSGVSQAENYCLAIEAIECIDRERIKRHGLVNKKTTCSEVTLTRSSFPPYQDHEPTVSVFLLASQYLQGRPCASLTMAESGYDPEADWPADFLLSKSGETLYIECAGRLGGGVFRLVKSDILEAVDNDARRQLYAPLLREILEEALLHAHNVLCKRIQLFENLLGSKGLHTARGYVMGPTPTSYTMTVSRTKELGYCLTVFEHRGEIRNQKISDLHVPEITANSKQEDKAKIWYQSVFDSDGFRVSRERMKKTRSGQYRRLPSRHDPRETYLHLRHLESASHFEIQGVTTLQSSQLADSFDRVLDGKNRRKFRNFTLTQECTMERGNTFTLRFWPSETRREHYTFTEDGQPLEFSLFVKNDRGGAWVRTGWSEFADAHMTRLQQFFRIVDASAKFEDDNPALGADSFSYPTPTPVR